MSSSAIADTYAVVQLACSAEIQLRCIHSYAYNISPRPYDALLIAATSPSQCPAQTRTLAEYDEMKDLRDSLLVKERSYRQQYANLYFVRLIMLRPPVLAAATARWGELQGRLLLNAQR